MTIRPEYKQTEVGLIPKDWDTYELKELVIFLDGQRRPVRSADRAKVQGLYPYYGASGIVDYVNNYIFNDDLILLAEDGENILSRTLPLAFRISGKAWVNNHAHVLKPKSQCSIGFLTNFLESLNYETLNSGTAQPKLNKKSCSSIPIALPPNKAEQEAIAEALSDADALIASLEQLIAKKRQIKQGAMQQLLTGRKRLPGFNEDSELKYIGQLLTIKHGKSQKAVETDSGAYPVLGTSGVLGYAERPLYEKPSVLIGRKGTIDRPQYIDTPFWSVDTLFYSQILDSNDAKYLFYRFWLINWKQYNEASGVPSLNAQTIESIEIKTPKPDEQAAIAEILSDMDAEITELETTLAKARQVKQGMMQQLLTGRIRLV